MDEREVIEKALIRAYLEETAQNLNNKGIKTEINDNDKIRISGLSYEQKVQQILIPKFQEIAEEWAEKKAKEWMKLYLKEEKKEIEKSPEGSLKML